MDGFNEYSDDSIEKILANLMDSQNIELKTEINNVPAISVLKVLSNYFAEKGLKKSAAVLNKYIDNFLMYMVSSGRKGRLEIIDAVKGMGNWYMRYSVKDKLTKDLKDI